MDGNTVDNAKMILADMRKRDRSIMLPEAYQRALTYLKECVDMFALKDFERNMKIMEAAFKLHKDPEARKRAKELRERAGMALGKMLLSYSNVRKGNMAAMSERGKKARELGLSPNETSLLGAAAAVQARDARAVEDLIMSGGGITAIASLGGKKYNTSNIGGGSSSSGALHLTLRTLLRLVETTPIAKAAADRGLPGADDLLELADWLTAVAKMKGAK